MTGENTAKQSGEAPKIIDVVIVVLPFFFAYMYSNVNPGLPQMMKQLKHQYHSPMRRVINPFL